MNYDLEFAETALKEFKKLDGPIQLQFKKKLKERLKQPRVQADQLRGEKDTYKIKLRASGYRLIYRVIESRLTVDIVKIGKRDKLYKS